MAIKLRTLGKTLFRIIGEHTAQKKAVETLSNCFISYKFKKVLRKLQANESREQQIMRSLVAGRGIGLHRFGYRDLEARNGRCQRGMWSTDRLDERGRPELRSGARDAS